MTDIFISKTLQICNLYKKKTGFKSSFKSSFKLGLISLIFLIFGCLNGFAESEQVFRRGNYDEPDTLDPQQAYAVSDINILYDIYEGLMTYDNNGRLILGQAESYTVSKDLKTYKFTLKKDLKWSNGEKLNAFDFVSSIRRAVDPKIGSVNYILLDPIKNSKQIYKGLLPVEKLGIRAIDSQTVFIELNNPTPYILDLLASPTFFPVYINKKNQKINSYINNGPFKLQEWIVNSHISIIKNNNYINNNKVKLDKVIFYPINQQSVELSRYRAGDLDYTNKVIFSELNWVKKNLPNELYNKPILASYYYSFNVTKQPFKNNKYLRKALALAIDKDLIAKNILGGNRLGTDNFVPKDISNYKNIPDLNQNLDKKFDKNFGEQKIILARKYFKLAGYQYKPGDKSVSLKLKLFFHTNEANKIIATAIASMWKKTLNIEVELINQEWKVFLKTRLDHNVTQVVREGWIAQYDDPLSFLSLFLSDNVQNTSGFNNKLYDNLINKAQKTIDKNLRIELLNQAEQILLDEVPVVPIYTPEVYHLVKPYIKGFNLDNRDRTFDKYIYL